MIQNTSKQSYQEIKDTLGPRQELVYNALKVLKKANNRMIAEYLKLPINSVTPRTKELRDRKKVGVAEIGIDPKTNKASIFWKVVK